MTGMIQARALDAAPTAALPVAASPARAPLVPDAGTSDSCLSILHVLAPSAVGGLESVVRLLAIGQRQRGHLVRVAAVVGPDEAENHPFLAAFGGTGVEVIPIGVPARAYRHEWREVESLCRHLAPHVVHTHGYRADLLAAAAARRVGVSTVTTLHGFCGGNWKNRLYEALERAVLRRFDAVVVVSRPLAARVAPCVAGELAVVPNGIPASGGHEREHARRLLGIPADARRLGWIGRFSWEKGADVMVAALTGLADAGVSLSFVGEGAEERAVRRLAGQLGIASRVHWHGRVQDAGRLLAAFDAVVLSSRTEGTPMVLLEAMSAGVPVVATRVGGVPDVVGDDEALLVPSGRPDALADALRRLFADPAATRERVCAARDRIARDFTFDAWLDSYESIYRRSLKRRLTTAASLTR